MELPKYQLESNPYRSGPLNPLKDPPGSRKPIESEPFLDNDAIDRILRQSTSSRRSALFVVVGRRGSGRTTVANHILHRYVSERKINCKRFCVPDIPGRTESLAHDMRSWAILLRAWLRKNAKVDDFVLNDLKEKIDPGTLLVEYQTRISAVADSLDREEHPTGFGALFEDVRTVERIADLREIFAESRTLVVCTAPLSLIEGNRPRGRRWILPSTADDDTQDVIELQDIYKEYVYLVATERWNAPTPPPPFAKQGIQDAFSRNRPIGTVLAMLAQMLDHKHSTSDEGAVWPDQRLKLSEDEIKDLVTKYEKGL